MKFVKRSIPENREMLKATRAGPSATSCREGLPSSGRASAAISGPIWGKEKATFLLRRSPRYLRDILTQLPISVLAGRIGAESGCCKTLTTVCGRPPIAKFAVSREHRPPPRPGTCRPYIVFTMAQSCAIVMLSAPVVPAAEPGDVDPVVVLAVVSPDGVLPAVEPLASPDVLPLPVADAVCIVLQSCLIRSCCSAVSFDQFALSSS